MLPKRLYRFFDKHEYAEAFMAGRVRFGTLQSYKEEYEDKERGDRTEGMGDLQVSGEALIVNVARGMSRTVPGIENLAVRADPRNHFIACFMACDEDDLPVRAKEFGEHCVAIEDPAALIDDLRKALQNDAFLAVNPPALEWGEVRYDKGAQVAKQFTRDEKLILAWIQKPEAYAHQKEFRIHFNFTSHELIGSPSHHTLSIGKVLPYCKLRAFGS
ncbi:MAG: hypothetical protein Q8J83_05740 [Nitrosomonas sp.]|nr:hypothetical protein [Nitrosomonas sp.]